MGTMATAFKALSDSLQHVVKPTVRATWGLRAFGLTKVPLLLYCGPIVRTLDETQCVVEIPLTWRTKNHYRSMYFGALAVGADCAAGLIAMHHIDLRGEPVQLLFKDLHADFLKRPEGDVHFICKEGAAVKALVDEAIRTGERVNHKLRIEAVVPSTNAMPVAVFDVTLSLKKARANS
jgi:acyl-coenzyme A thioesterase PaaI-like protein